MAHDNSGKKGKEASNKHPGQTLKGVLQEAGWTSIVRGAIEPLIRKAAEALGRVVPGDSWIRTEWGEHILGGAKQFIEEYAKHFPQPWALGAEAFTDILDMAGLAGTHKDSPAEVKVSNWMGKFQDGWEKRISEAPLADLPQLQKRLRSEFRLRKALVKMLEQFRKEEEEEAKAAAAHAHDPNAAPIDFDWDGAWRKLDAMVAKAFGALNGLLKKSDLSKKAPARKRSWLLPWFNQEGHDTEAGEVEPPDPDPFANII